VTLAPTFAARTPRQLFKGTYTGQSNIRGYDMTVDGRDFLMGDALGAADVFAWPFLRYARGAPPDDDDAFHTVLVEHLSA